MDVDASTALMYSAVASLPSPMIVVAAVVVVVLVLVLDMADGDANDIADHDGNEDDARNTTNADTAFIFVFSPEMKTGGGSEAELVPTIICSFG
jgi:hypothetical protein